MGIYLKQKRKHYFKGFIAFRQDIFRPKVLLQSKWNLSQLDSEILSFTSVNEISETIIRNIQVFIVGLKIHFRRQKLEQKAEFINKFRANMT